MKTHSLQSLKKYQRLAPWLIFAEMSLLGVLFTVEKVWPGSNRIAAALCIFLGLLLVVLTIIACLRKYPIELTDAERQQPIEGRVDYSNHFSWGKTLLLELLIGYTLIVCCLLPIFIPYWIDGGMAAMWREVCSVLSAVPPMWWVLFAFCYVAPFVIIAVRSRNQYIIEGDTLIVRENFLFKRVEELRLPIGSISHLYVTNPWNPNPRLYIEVDDVSRGLSADTYPLELAVELLRRRDVIKTQNNR